MAFNEHVKAVYDLATSAVSGRTAMKDAITTGQTAAYHRAVRQSPEVRIVDMLLSARRQLGDLARERKRLTEMSPAHMPTHRRTLELEQVEQAIGQVAEGSLLWASEQLGRPFVPSMLQPTSGSSGSSSDAINSGETEVV